MCWYTICRYEGCGDELFSDLPIRRCKTAIKRAVDPDAEMPCLGIKILPWRYKKIVVPGLCHDCSSSLFRREPSPPLKGRRGGKLRIKAIVGNAPTAKSAAAPKATRVAKIKKEPARKPAKAATKGKENSEREAKKTVRKKLSQPGS
ncbi:hypothetical protein TWF696_009357 [Orbilia brochopaga]|uniref:Uncharacterized protein n=1 Tax=Orbilia brochopaga TaxID=3140254 RepID=A0AAV9UIF1_9PEZI